MFNPKMHIGESFGIYTITELLPNKDSDGHYLYKGECRICGYVKKCPYGGFIKCKNTINCRHFDVPEWKTTNTRLHTIYHDMKRRCYNPSDRSYRWYGGKGIKICKAWLNNPVSFEAWALTNGYSDDFTIDRIDSNKDYSPKNCRWISAADNSKYKSSTKLIEVDGELHTGREWAKVLNLGINRINNYIKRYGIENTIEFIRRFKKNPVDKGYFGSLNLYDIYMKASH